MYLKYLYIEALQHKYWLHVWFSQLLHHDFCTITVYAFILSKFSCIFHFYTIRFLLNIFLYIKELLYLVTGEYLTALPSSHWLKTIISKMPLEMQNTIVTNFLPRCVSQDFPRDGCVRKWGEEMACSWWSHWCHLGREPEHSAWW